VPSPTSSSTARCRDHPPDAAARIGNVALPAWDDVDVGVRDGLACCQAVIEPDIESIRLVLCQQPLADTACSDSSQIRPGSILQKEQGAKRAG
jgi:hypothetical protein